MGNQIGERPYRRWLSSDYMLKALSLDPAHTRKRLGDGFYEQKLIREQIAQLTGRRLEGELQSGGALIAGNDIKLDITGDLLNGGVIAGRQVVTLTAQNINNLQGRLLGNDIGISARTDLNNIGGMIEANDNLIASAGRDLNVITTTRTQTNAQGSRTNIERVAGLYVTGGTGSLLTGSGRDTNLIAAAIQNQGNGDTGILAANDIDLGVVTTTSMPKPPT